MLEKVRQLIQKFALIPDGSTVVIAVSGGADSLALMHVLYRLRDRMGFKVHVATLNHQLRGKSGVADAQFVVETAKKWEMPITAGVADVKALAAREKMGIESAARKARYGFLAEVADQQQASIIATAHHADDQAETVLMHLLRGSGLNGLRGMSLYGTMSEYAHLTLIRPFLYITRQEIDIYCTENNLQPREDETNQDTSLLRNRLRHEVLPYLEQINPQIRLSLTRLADIAATDNDQLEASLHQQGISNTALQEGERATISYLSFDAMHTALQRRWVLWAAKMLAPTAADQPSYERVTDAAALAKAGKHGAIALLGSGLRLRVDYGLIVVEKETAPPMDYDYDGPLLEVASEIALHVPGETRINDKWYLCVGSEQADIDSKQVAMVTIPPKASLTLRTRRQGERFTPPGLGGHTHKVSRWMIDQKIPTSLRDKLPILTINGQIAAIWIPSQWIVAHGYAGNPSDENCIYFHFRENL